MANSVKDTIGLPFTLFRARDALPYEEAGVMTAEPASTTATAQFSELIEGGMLEGSKVSLLFSRPGLSLTHAWFKTGFPLPRHSHNADCAYFIISGTLRIGTEELGPGDGFFVGSDVPYTYIPGEGGVEVLEIRTADLFDIKLLVNNQAWWDKAAERLREVTPRWPEETAPPSGIKIGV
jgi:hypothetical protein